jgi:coenzyme F420-reducing hydrogenase alpha subunit
MKNKPSGPKGKAGKKASKTIKVDYLARVEGEGSLFVRLKGDEVADVKFKIFEPPRFFEAFLRGRRFSEAPDITARICGICPIAYQMSSVHAMEQIGGVAVGGPLRDLRRLIYCGEWIESHVLHVAMLHAPDFLGYEDAIRMARDHPDIVKTALRMKKAGNALVALIGGREIHPINVRVGGFFRAPEKAELAPVAEELKWAREAARELVRWTAKLDFPDFERDYEFVGLRHAEECPFNEGRLVSNRGLDIAISDFEQHFVEEHVEHSHALQCALRSRGSYFVGPQARYSLNFDRLSPLAQEAALEAGLGKVSRNPFQSIVVRSVETLYACDEALRIIEAYEKPDRPAVDVPARAGVGFGCTEAPRGICWHKYRTDANGIIQEAKIVPPTSQNQRTMEDDLWEFVPKYVDLPDDELTWKCEQAIRNYDPCISCATHFLKLRIERA